MELEKKPHSVTIFGYWSKYPYFHSTVKLDFKNRQDKNQLGFKNTIANDLVDQISFKDRQDKKTWL